MGKKIEPSLTVLIFLSGQQILDYSKGFLFNFIYLHLMPLAVKNQYLLRILYRLEKEIENSGRLRREIRSTILTLCGFFFSAILLN